MEARMLWDFEAPIFCRQSAHRFRWRQPYSPAALYPQGRFLIVISVRGWVDTRAGRIISIEKIQWPHRESYPQHSGLYHNASTNHAIACPLDSKAVGFFYMCKYIAASDWITETIAEMSTATSPICWSQWPRGRRHELSSLSRTLGSWVRIPLKVWMSVFYAFILCLCCTACR
jgi:hypothetical protein